jgi:DNA (cytosine-5)-methyltransferase 1
VEYLSCFSGIGGLEGADAPVLVSEIDPDCQKILEMKYPTATIHSDIEKLKPPKVDLVAGGWPCQDISVAGLQKGLTGAKSRLLYDLLRVSVEAQAETLLAENVTNLLRMADGDEFQETIKGMHDHGFPYVSWRVLNARQFGLPQHRTRVLIIASKREDVALSIFRHLPQLSPEQIDPKKKSDAAGFYWTAGIHSINYSEGYTPTVKIGSSLKIASPPAVHFEDVVRQLSAKEALALQGFEEDLSIVSQQAQYRMAGNAVPKPMGRWLFKGVEEGLLPSHDLRPKSFQGSFFPELEKPKFGSMGLSTRGNIVEFEDGGPLQKAINLIDFLDKSSSETLSSRAAKGLLLRLDRSGQACPPALRANLEELAKR